MNKILNLNNNNKYNIEYITAMNATGDGETHSKATSNVPSTLQLISNHNKKHSSVGKRFNERSQTGTHE